MIISLYKFKILLIIRRFRLSDIHQILYVSEKQEQLQIIQLQILQLQLIQLQIISKTICFLSA